MRRGDDTAPTTKSVPVYSFLVANTMCFFANNAGISNVHFGTNHIIAKETAEALLLFGTGWGAEAELLIHLLPIGAK